MDGKGSRVAETVVEFTLSGARDLKKKMFGKISPCAVVTVSQTNLTQVSNPSPNGGSSPAWNQVMTFTVPDAILQSQNPRPSIRVDIFDSAGLSKSLGEVTIPLAKPIAEYGQTYQSTLGVIRKGRVQGYLNFGVKVEKPSFAPNKGTPEYDTFVKNLIPPAPAAPRPQAYRPAQGYAAPGYAAPGYAAQGYAAPHGYPQQAYGAPAGYPPAGYSQGYPPQPMYAQPGPYGYPSQPGMPPQQVVYMDNNRRRDGSRGWCCWWAAAGINVGRYW